MKYQKNAFSCCNATKISVKFTWCAMNKQIYNKKEREKRKKNRIHLHFKFRNNYNNFENVQSLFVFSFCGFYFDLFGKIDFRTGCSVTIFFFARQCVDWLLAFFLLLMWKSLCIDKTITVFHHMVIKFRWISISNLANPHCSSIVICLLLA